MSWNHDPQDNRFNQDAFGYHDYGTNGHVVNSYPYPTDLDNEDFSDNTGGHNSPPAHSQHHYTPSNGSIGMISSFIGSFSDSSRWNTGGSRFDTGTSRRLSTEWTDPDLGASRFVPTGPRCIFHWNGCQERYAEYSNWVGHVDSHLPPTHPSQPEYRRDFAGMPYSWTCGFPGCQFSIGNQPDHQQLWDRKLEHSFEHLSKGCKPEDMCELDSWMRYYHKRGLCSKSDAMGHIQYPPVHSPYSSGHNEPRRQPKKGNKKPSSYSPLPSGAPLVGPPSQGQQLPSPGATGDHAPPVHEQQFTRPGSYIAPEPMYHQGGQPAYQLAHQPQPGYQPAPYGSSHPPAHPGYDAYAAGHMYPPHGQPMQPVQPYPAYPSY
ncbi:hypothetical protein ABW21_db0207189 [Orbilia brochopaga]|nr:hypothetical protein ABW21_db0207189 [Drechslerella brochopaga]